MQVEGFSHRATSKGHLRSVLFLLLFLLASATIFSGDIMHLQNDRVDGLAVTACVSYTHQSCREAKHGVATYTWLGHTRVLRSGAEILVLVLSLLSEQRDMNPVPCLKVTVAGISAPGIGITIMQYCGAAVSTNTLPLPVLNESVSEKMLTMQYMRTC